MSTVTAEFLECTPYTALPSGSLVAPISVPTTTATATTTNTVWVTSYCVTLPAACPTSEWIATYTIETTCTGDQAAWTAPSVPPEFVVTTVTCDVCAHPTQTITCPNAAATGVTVEGNGVTATVAATPGSGAATVTPIAATGTGSTPAATGTGTPFVTAGAPLSMKKSLGLMAGFALIAGQFLMM